MSADDTVAPPVPPDEEFALHPWICRRCEWAIFWEGEAADGVVSAYFRCGYPDPELQREAAEAARMTRCAHYRQRSEWPLAKAADAIVHVLPQEE